MHLPESKVRRVTILLIGWIGKMGEAVYLWVFAYDVVEDRIRNQIADELLEHGIRVQNSVFELRLTKSSANRLWMRIRGMALIHDTLRMYKIPTSTFEDIRAQNGPPRPEPYPGFWML
jgi:CRISPR-associated endonuclease Cas2